MSKNDFTNKINDYDTFSNIDTESKRIGKLIVAKGFDKLPKV